MMKSSAEGVAMGPRRGPDRDSRTGRAAVTAAEISELEEHARRE